MVDNDFTDNEGGDEEDVDFFASRNDAFEDADDADDGSYSKGVPATKRKRKRRKLGKRKKGETTKTVGKQAARRHENTTINPDSVLRGGECEVDLKEGDADGYSGGEDDEDDSDNDLFKEKRYKKTKAKNWTKHTNRSPGRDILPIPFGGTTEFFRPKVSDEELKGFTCLGG